MRLFIGIKTYCESELIGLQNVLREAGRGSFTHAENLHITLKFLGEMPGTCAARIQEAMDEIETKPFSLECRGAHLFNKKGIAAAKVGGDIAALNALHKTLEDALAKRGFTKDTRSYRPHITLARKYHPDAGANIEAIPFAPCSFAVDEIILFESKRMNGRLVYEKAYSKIL